MEHADWPRLSLRAWEPTYLTLHRWLQIVGKLKLALAVPLNHWWHVTLHLTPYGLTTLDMPLAGTTLEIAFDFQHHRLVIRSGDGRRGGFALAPMSVARFYERLRGELRALGVDVDIWPVPVECVDRTPFSADETHREYDGDAVRRVHRVLLSTERVFERHRARFLGKASPVHFFWGAFDLAVTRFSGRVNPSPPADRVMRVAYSHEVISHGFWPGGDWPIGGRLDEAVFYAYAVPEPRGFSDEPGYDDTFHEILLPYEAVRQTDDPDATLLTFMQTSYRAAARAADWPRELDCDDPLTWRPDRSRAD